MLGLLVVIAQFSFVLIIVLAYEIEIAYEIKPQKGRKYPGTQFVFKFL